MRILIAEDEKKVAHFIRKALKQEGHAVDEVHDGNEALERAMVVPYDAIVLDIMMPGRDGLSVLRLLRKERAKTPILLLTARGEVSERIEGLDLGADDYMSKPFSMGELIARINAMTRRVTGERSLLLRAEDLVMNIVSREVTRAGKPVSLALREFSLLEFLLRSPGRVLSRTNICEHVWDHHFDTGTNVVDVYIQRLRRKIDDDHEVKLIHTIRGVGYMLRGAA